MRQDAAQWQAMVAAALLAMDRADALLARDPAAKGPAANDTAQKIRTSLELEEKDRRMTATLQEIRLERAETNVQENRFDFVRTAAQYSQAFRNYGINSDDLEPAQAASMISARPTFVREQLVAGLDNWFISCLDKDKKRIWLTAVTQLADPDTWRNQVRAASLAKDRPAMERLAEEVDVRTQPATTIHLLERMLINNQALPKAIALLLRAQQYQPHDVWINHDLGFALLGQQPPSADAIRYLTAAVALRPDSPGMRLNLAMALVEIRQIDQAMETYQSTIRLAPKYGAAHYSLGRLYMQKSRWDEAITALQAAAELMPERQSGEAHTYLGVCFENVGRVEEAIAEYRQSIRAEPSYVQSHFQLGLALTKQNQLDPAIAAFQEAIRRDKNYDAAHLKLAEALLKKGGTEGAIRHYREVIRLKPDWAQGHAGLGETLRKQRKPTEAISELREAVRLDPSLVVANHNLGWALSDAGQWDEAASYWRQAQALLEKNVADHPENVANVTVLARTTCMWECDTARMEMMNRQKRRCNMRYRSWNRWCPARTRRSTCCRNSPRCSTK